MYLRMTLYPFKFHCGGEEIQNACCIEQQNSIDEPEKKKTWPHEGSQFGSGLTWTKCVPRPASCPQPFSASYGHFDLFLTPLLLPGPGLTKKIPTLVAGISVRNGGKLSKNCPLFIAKICQKICRSSGDDPDPRKIESRTLREWTCQVDFAGEKAGHPGVDSNR